MSDNKSQLNIEQMLEGGIHRMSHVYRYSSVPVIHRENVAEHSWYVAFYAYLIGQDLAQQGYEIDFGEMLSRALVHDLDESMTGDFLRYVKYGHPDLKKALDEVSIRMLRKMGDDIGVNFEPHWAKAKADDIEGQIIQVVDLARVISYVYGEMMTGNGHVSHILEECSNYIQEFATDNPDSPVKSYAESIIGWVRMRSVLRG